MRKNLSLANQLIATLPTQERGLFLANCELVELKLHEMVCLAGHVCEHVWFPVEGFVSIIFPVLGAAETAVAQVGSEGMFHISAAFDLNHSAFNCRVQAPGRAFRMTSATFQRHLSIGAACVVHSIVIWMHACANSRSKRSACITILSKNGWLARY